MKKILTTLIAVTLLSPLMAGVVKESQARVEVDDAKQALDMMDKRTELNDFLPELESYRARAFYAKSVKYLDDSEYDKASFYAILSTNAAKQSIARGLVLQQERKKLEDLAAGRALELVAPTLRAAGLKQKGKSPVFAGTYGVKELYNIRSRPWQADKVPAAVTPEMATKVADIASILKTQPDVKVDLSAAGRTTDHADKYAGGVKDAFIEKGVDAARIQVTTKKGKDGVTLTLDGVKSK